MVVIEVTDGRLRVYPSLVRDVARCVNRANVEDEEMLYAHCNQLDRLL
jgi:hypothetical protein